MDFRVRSDCDQRGAHSVGWGCAVKLTAGNVQRAGIRGSSRAGWRCEAHCLEMCSDLGSGLQFALAEGVQCSSLLETCGGL